MIPKVFTRWSSSQIIKEPIHFITHSNNIPKTVLLEAPTRLTYMSNLSEFVDLSRLLGVQNLYLFSCHQNNTKKSDTLFMRTWIANTGSQMLCFALADWVEWQHDISLYVTGTINNSYYPHVDDWHKLQTTTYIEQTLTCVDKHSYKVGLQFCNSDLL